MIKAPPIILLFAGICIAIFFLYFQLNPVSSTSNSQYSHLIEIADKKMYVELAETPDKITRGLSGRSELKDGNGMLFIFPYAENVSFWMPDMYFPIDIIFLRNNQVIYIEHNVPNPPLDTPRDKLPQYSPKQPVDMVLEVPAGWSQRNNINLGNKLSLNR